MHDDSYGIITYNRISILEETNNVLRKDSSGPITPDTNAKPAPASGTNPGTEPNTSQPAKSETNPPINPTNPMEKNK